MSASDDKTQYRALNITLVVVGFFVVWQLAVMLGRIPDYLLPAPSDVFVELASAPGWYFMHTARTVGATLLGFSAALIVGYIAAVAIVYSRFLEDTLYTLLIAMNSVPKVALAPIFIIWMGTGLTSKVAISFLIALFAIVVDTVLGLRSVDPDAIDLFRSLRGGRVQTLLWLRAPNALPYLFSGMKLAISLALVGAISAEFIASQAGLGYVILASQGAFQTTRVFAAVVLLGFIGTILFVIIDQAERVFCPWHISHRARHREKAAD